MSETPVLKRKPTNEELLKLRAEKRMQRLKERGNSFLLDPERALRKDDSENKMDSSGNNAPNGSDAVNIEKSDRGTFSPSIFDAINRTPTNTKEISNLSSMEEEPKTPKTPVTPVINSPSPATVRNILVLDQPSPLSPDTNSPSNYQKLGLKEETTQILEEEDDEDEVDAFLSRKSVLVSNIVQYLRVILTLIFATYSAFYSCFVPCDPISKSYLHSRQIQALESNNAEYNCSERANAILFYDWSKFSPCHISTWPYVPPLVLFLTIQLVMIIPYIINHLTLVKRNKNRKTFIETFLFALRVYNRMRKLLTEICLFIFTYIIVVTTLKYIYGVRA